MIWIILYTREPTVIVFNPATHDADTYSISTGDMAVTAKYVLAGAAALLASAALAGCSIARLAYNNADWLILRELDAYLDLSPAQEAQAAARLRSRLEAHRRTELLDYARYLESVRLMARDGLAADEADLIVDKGYALARRTIRNAVPAIVPSLVTVSNHQIAHLESHLTEVNRAYREEFLPDSRKVRLERRVRRTVARIEHWVGTLREDQILLAKKLRDDFPDSAEDWLAYNAGKQRALVKMLKAGADASAVETFLVHWWAEFRGRPPSLERRNQAMIEGIKRLIVSVDATLDERQRKFLLWRLTNYIDQIEMLKGRTK